VGEDRNALDCYECCLPSHHNPLLPLSTKNHSVSSVLLPHCPKQVLIWVCPAGLVYDYPLRLPPGSTIPFPSLPLLGSAIEARWGRKLSN